MALPGDDDEFDRSITDPPNGTPITTTRRSSICTADRTPNRRRNLMPRINKRDPLGAATLIADRARPTTARHRNFPHATPVSE